MSWYAVEGIINAYKNRGEASKECARIKLNYWTDSRKDI